MVISIDLGTSGCRSAVFDEDMHMLSSAVRDYPLITLSDTEIEQDADLWWMCVKETLKEAVRSLDADPSGDSGDRH